MSETPTNSRDAWVRAYDSARRRFGARTRVRVTLLDPAEELAFIAVALKLTTSGSGAEEVLSAFGRSDVEALDALVEAFKTRSSTRGAGGEAA